MRRSMHKVNFTMKYDANHKHETKRELRRLHLTKPAGTGRHRRNVWARETVARDRNLFHSPLQHINKQKRRSLIWAVMRFRVLINTQIVSADCLLFQQMIVGGEKTAWGDRRTSAKKVVWQGKEGIKEREACEPAIRTVQLLTIKAGKRKRCWGTSCGMEEISNVLISNYKKS